MEGTHGALGGVPASVVLALHAVRLAQEQRSVPNVGYFVATMK
jgi:hypothetical protein